MAQVELEFFGQQRIQQKRKETSPFLDERAKRKRSKKEKTLQACRNRRTHTHILRLTLLPPSQVIMGKKREPGLLQEERKRLISFAV